MAEERRQVEARSLPSLTAVLNSPTDRPPTARVDPYRLSAADNLSHLLRLMGI